MMVNIARPAKAMATASGFILEGEGSSTIDSRAVPCMINPSVYQLLFLNQVGARNWPMQGCPALKPDAYTFQSKQHN